MAEPIDEMTPEKWQELTAGGRDPLDYISIENWHILVAKEIDPVGYLTPSQWRQRALNQVNAEVIARFLPDLDQIPWSSLEHAEGPASDLPDILRASLSDDDLAAGVAWSDLFSVLCREYAVYDATVAVVPYLLRLLDSPDARHREYVLNLLTYLLRAIVPPHPSSASPPSDQLRAILAQHGRDLDEELRQQRRWEQTVRQMILEKTEYIRTLLVDRDETVQKTARSFFEVLEETTNDPD